jgi:cation transporter-like permease
MNEFMVLVERAVRPVQAGPTKKLRMREELLAHLMAIHEEELARLGEDSAARTEAIRRFGDSAALTVELQQSVKWSDRIDARLNRMYGWRPGESAARSAARLAGLVATMILFWMCFALAVTAVRRPHDGTVPTSEQLVQLFGALAVCAPAAVFVMAMLTARIRDSLYGTPRSWRRVAGLAGLSLVLLPVLGSAFSLAGLPDAGQMVKELTTTRSIVTSVGGYLFVALFMVWFAWKTGPSHTRQVEWASLDIGQ